MITIYSNQPVSLATKSALSKEVIATQLGSDTYDTTNTPWFGDLLTVESLFPQWILKEYENNPTNVTIVPVIKNYFRWLFSLEYGYGAQLNWENIRVPLYMNSIFLEALADFYFPGADFSQAPLSSILPNIRTFATKIDANYFNIKGLPESIKYVLCGLLGFGYTDVYVTTTTYCSIQIQVTAAQYDALLEYEAFLATYIIPAGTVVTYEVI